MFCIPKQYDSVMVAADEAWAWLRRHEAAFNRRDVEVMLADYADDAVLEAHLAGGVVELTGREEIRVGLAAAAGREVTTVRRVIADDSAVAAQILGEDGRTAMASFWELRDGRIQRDVSILCGDSAVPVDGAVPSVAGAYLRAVNERSIDGLRALFSADAVVRHPTGTRSGIDVISGWYETEVFPGRPHLTALRTAVAGPTVVLEVRADGAPGRPGATTQAVDVFTVGAFGSVTALDVYYC